MAEASIVLDKYQFDPRSDDIILEMRGKPGGIMQFLLGFLGLDTKVYFIVARSHLTFRFVSFGGQTTIMCPLDTVTAMFAGVAKPMWALYGGLLLALFGLFQLGSTIGMAALAVGAGLVFYFWITKGLTIAFSTGDMLNVYGLVFDAQLPKDAGGEKLTEQRLMQVVEHINRVLQNIHSGDYQHTVVDIPISPDDLIDDEADSPKPSYNPDDFEVIDPEPTQTKPSRPADWLRDAQPLWQQEDYEGVLEITNALLEVHPDFKEAWKVQASAYKKVRDKVNYIKAMETLKRLN